MPAIPLTDLYDENHPFWKKENEKCPKCKRPLEGLMSGDELMEILKRGYCDDCYYEAMGEEIEKHPICSPRVHRG
jgi:hypothetical protein